MATKNKIHEYKGYKFNIKVELNYQVERSLDGKREHKITFNHMGLSNYYQTHLCETKDLVKSIDTMVRVANEWVDERENPKSEEEKLLEGLGFN